MEPVPVTDRTRVTRLADRQVVDRQVLHDVLDAGLVAHVAVVRDGVPIVLPVGYARDGESVLLHGSTGGGLLRAAASGVPVAVTVTLLDGLVYARSLFDSSMNYRSVMVLGTAVAVPDALKEEALRRLSEHLMPGRWDEVRPPTRRELAATVVLRVPLDEVSVKVRATGASTEPDDGEDRAVWAGVVPLTLATLEPVASADAPRGVPVPASVAAAASRFEALRPELHA
ncbi:pyridoxamine 5'-phosphate oxidase family protein [Amnibacterium sp. CER49]|uniref:pyridoxamine 5'-phosphate oxidase family protein n=1 Tax=Amnibacterium sp. CER49 TaxID=3039161 RepID=UPI00244C7D5B|nr:pyridoxamine 5'-phosphate oxidase family protein [Amnibacterium sp. CER49]MDH2444157.1 pyridoxamine 5'-phosphate oxidase family protein [Amnibacterium sp. CER49]